MHHQVAEIDGVHLGEPRLVLAVDLGGLAVGELAGVVARHLVGRAARGPSSAG